MPAKWVKLGSRMVEVVSIKLPNGNLVIPARAEHDRTIAIWKEVKPKDPDHKRWLPVAEERDDPRDDPAYISRIKAMMATPEYKKWAKKQ